METKCSLESLRKSPCIPLNKGDARTPKSATSLIKGDARTPRSATPLIKGGEGGFGFDKSVPERRGLISTGFHLPYNPRLKEDARQLRKNPTPAEKKIWYGYLRNFEYPVLRQRPIDNYVVDFYCPEYRLVVEIDGDSHFTDEGKAYDQKRTKILERYGLRIIRFTNQDVLQNLEAVIGRIEELVEDLNNPPIPLKDGVQKG